MMKMKPWRIAFVALAALSLASCSKEKDPMEWKADEPVQATGNAYVVSADEQTITFTCSNYTDPWFSGAQDNGEDILLEKDNPGLIGSENFRAEMQGNKLTIGFKENESAQERTFSITVTAGEISYTFHFKQAGNTVWQSTCQVKYSIYSISDDLLQFYDFSAVYLDLDGKLHTEVITGNSWYYVPDPLSIADAPEEFKCRIVGVRKNDLPELTDDYYEIGYGVDVHVAFINPDGEEVFREKQPQLSSLVWHISKTEMQKFLEKNHEIELATISPTISKSDAIEKLKSKK
ncbi:MAG: BACON domain-containing protein [Bacteroidales bacterium]|nr:BACON domain-containing protein [Bacteroidales bacterium]